MMFPTNEQAADQALHDDGKWCACEERARDGVRDKVQRIKEAVLDVRDDYAAIIHKEYPDEYGGNDTLDGVIRLLEKEWRTSRRKTNG